MQVARQGLIFDTLTEIAADGTLRGDVDAADVLVGTSGICMAVADPQGREQAGRLLDLLVDGLRPR